MRLLGRFKVCVQPKNGFKRCRQVDSEGYSLPSSEAALRAAIPAARAKWDGTDRGTVSIHADGKVVRYRYAPLHGVVSVTRLKKGER